MKWLGKVAVLLVLAVLALSPVFAGGGQSGGGSAPIVIGGVSDLTGPGAVLGVATANGWDMAVKDINAKGGINGRQLKLIVYDCKSDPQEGITVFRRLAQVDNACVVLGPSLSNVGLATAQVARELGVSYFGQFGDPRCMLGEDLKTLNPYMFLVQPSAIQSGILSGAYPWEVMGKKKAAVLQAIDHAYCKTQADAFVEYAKKVGIEVTTIQSNRQADIDMTVQLTAIKNSGADYLFNANPTQPLVVSVNQMYQMGMGNMVLCGSLDFSNPFNTLVTTPAAASNIYFPVNLDMEDPKLADITARYKAAYRNADPTPKSWMSYDQVLIVEEAIKRAGSADRKAIRDTMETIANVKTLISDTWTMDPATHMPLDLEMCIYNIENGVYTNKGWFAPSQQ